MQRELDHLSQQQFDVIVIGGGIHGAYIAKLAAERGYHTALITDEDFASGTSANSFKLLHGGLRYLQHLNFKRIAESLISRNAFLRAAPQLIKYQPFMIPLRSGGLTGPWVMRLAFALYQLIATSFQQGLAKPLRMPAPSVVSREVLCKTMDYPPEYIAGGRWYEAVVESPQCLVVEMVRQASVAGARVANYLRADALLHHAGSVVGVLATDTLGESQLSLKARWVIDATGHLVGGLRAAGDVQFAESHNSEFAEMHLARAHNVLVKRKLADEVVLGIELSDALSDQKSLVKSKLRSRMVFIMPWRERCLIGTFYQPADAKLSQTISDADKQRMLDDINSSALIKPALSSEDVCYWHTGWLMRDHAAQRDDIVLKDHAELRSFQAGEGGLIEVLGVKFTTAPVVAKQAIKRLARHCKPSGTPTHSQPRQADKQIDPVLCRRYGQQAGQVQSLLDAEPELNQALDEQHKIGEVVYAVRHLAAQRLADVIWRRLPEFDAMFDDTRDSTVDNALLTQCAEIMQAELGWSDARRAAEIADCKNKSVYQR